MGIKLDLDTIRTTEHILPARAVRVPARPFDSNPLTIAAALIAVLLLAIVLRPVRVTVQGRTQVLPTHVTVGQAAALLHLPATPGDLVDVTGGVLRQGAGRQPLFVVNGVAAEPTMRLGSGDTIAYYAGGDLVEPVRERAALREGTARAGLARPAVEGTRRVATGMISGKSTVEVTEAVATVPAAPVTSRARLVAITFDDGPWPSQTSRILATLRKHNAHATFFILGNLARAHPALVREILQQDSEVGLHSWNHENLAHLSGAAVTANMARTQAQVQALTGKPVHLMRPPYGALSGVATRALKAAGYRIILWSADTSDWRRPGANTIYSRLMRGARSGAIILCHDGGGSRTGTIAAVARAVPALQARGYQLVTVSQVLGLQAVPQGGALVAGGQRYEVKAVEPGLAVSLDNQPVALTETPVEVNGQLLVPLKALADELGTKWQWSREAQKLTLEGALETFTLRLNSNKLERQYGQAETLPAPPVLYRDTLMVPLWVMLQATGATALYDDKTATLLLISLDKGIASTKLGQGPPPEWGKDVKWREYLKTR